MQGHPIWLEKDRELSFHRLFFLIAIIQEYPNLYKLLNETKSASELMQDFSQSTHLVLDPWWQSFLASYVKFGDGLIFLVLGCLFLADKPLSTLSEKEISTLSEKEMAYLDAASFLLPVSATDPLPMPTIKPFNPRCKSKKEYLEEINNLYAEYVSLVENRYSNLSRTLYQRKGLSHYIWTAWRVVEKMSWNRIADRAAERGQREGLSHVGVLKAVEKTILACNLTFQNSS